MDEPFIPLYPGFFRDLISHWVQENPSEGARKYFFLFTVSHKNISARGSSGYLKKIFSKMKTISIAFMHFYSENRVEKYENTFYSLCDSLSTAKTLKYSSDYLQDVYEKEPGFKNGFQSYKGM